jgi:hypothetical protein
VDAPCGSTQRFLDSRCVRVLRLTPLLAAIAFDRVCTRRLCDRLGRQRALAVEVAQPVAGERQPPDRACDAGQLDTRAEIACVDVRVVEQHDGVAAIAVQQ